MFRLILSQICIYPYLSYCCLIWGHACATYLNKLLVLQKRIMRVIHGTHRLHPSRTLFLKSGILNIYKIHKLQLGIFCQEFNLGISPLSFRGYLRTVGEVHNHFTRSSDLFYLVKSRTTIGDNSIRYKAPLYWNTLLPIIRNTQTLQHLKNRNWFHYYYKNHNLGSILIFL